jgi:quercetin dioxygenase-like cupin family protein
MHAAHSAQRTARLVPVRSTDMVEVLGPTIQFLTAPETDDANPCIMRGTVPSGVFVPLHSHADPETCILISGELDALTHSDAGFEWVRLKEADVFHVPADARHAFRNVSPASATMILVSTAKMGRFFREIGAPIIPGAQPGPLADRIPHFLQIAERYGYWNATQDQNAEVGLSVPGPS